MNYCPTCDRCECCGRKRYEHACPPYPTYPYYPPITWGQAGATGGNYRVWMGSGTGAGDTASPNYQLEVCGATQAR